MKLSTLNPYLYSCLMAGVLLLSSCEDNKPDTPTPTTTEYTVTFDAGTGGTLTSTATVKVKSGEKVAEPTAPTRPNYTFSEWQTADGTTFDFATQTITADITLTAKWNKVSYSITFELDGGTLPSGFVSPQTIADNTVPTLPIPTQDGAVFVDWYNEAERTTVYTPAVLTMDTTLYAQWDKTSYSIAFELNQGTLVGDNPLTVAPGVTPTLPANPTRSGAVFINWFTDADFTNPPYTPAVLTANITLYAQWGYNLAFTLNGGQLPDGVLNPEVVPENTTPTLPVITKPNAVFVDWYKEAELTTVYTPAELKGNLTLYAQWSPAKYSITFELDGGTLPDGTSNPQPIADNTVPTVPTPTQDGAVFVNWYNEAELTTVYTPAELTTNITLYAQWEYNITLDLNGGTLPTDAQNPQVVEAGSRLSRESLPRPTKSTYRFLGWYTEAGLTTRYKPEVINAGRTLYARWETKFTVAFDLDGGTLSGRSGDMISKTYREGLVPTLPTDPTKDSQSFAGWFTDSGLNNAYTPAALTTNIDLYAKWVDPPFTVSVAIDGNTVAGTISEASKTITFLLPTGIAASDLASLTPSFTDASSSPTTAQDFRAPVTYAVTKTGATQATTYSVKLRVRDKAQLKVFLGVIAISTPPPPRS